CHWKYDLISGQLGVDALLPVGTRLSTIADASMMLRQKIASNLILIPQGPRTVQLWAYGCYFRAMTACQITWCLQKEGLCGR
ncbi:hypothetical protein FQN53_008382, partial [Emmonsiellopsis sp. PD_33]